MKSLKFWAASVAVMLAIAVCVSFSVPSDFASFALAGDHSALYSASAALIALRAEHTDLVARAAAKIGEIVDGMAPDAVRKIEQDHADLVRQVNEKVAAIAAEEARSAAPAPAPTDPVAAERARTAEITSLAIRHGMPADFASGHITAGTDIAAVRSAILDAVAVRSAAPGNINPRVTVVTDEGDTLRAAVENAIEHRASPSAVKLTDAGRQFRGMKLMEMGRAFIEESTGQRVRGLSTNEMAGFVLGLDSGLGRRAGGAMSTSDFPNILANVVSKRLRNAYEVAQQNWKALARQSNAPDFKAKAIVQLSNLPTFKKVGEGGEFTGTALSEGKEGYALATYGRIVRITRQTIINDDMNAFDRVPSLMGRAAAETEASIVWAIITGNQVMGDGKALFHADHGNLANAGAAISVASLNAGRAAMRKQKGLAEKPADAEPLNLSPAFLVVSPDKETEAQQFLADIRANEAGKVNPFANSLQQITEARLTGNAWYLVASPSVIDTIEYAYLDGEEGLYTEQRLGFEVDGLEIKGRLDFAAKAIEFRGLYKNPGE